MINWISIYRCVPKENQEVLGYCKYGNFHIVHLVDNVFFDNHIYEQEITHWTSLPYEPEESEYGSDVRFAYLTGDGIKIIEPGKTYNENLEEIQ